ncbi:sugar kinase [Phytohabitans kaempferiae]|uniref:Sugar kinase n=1 Tax=Phytohabitans kaempferiae TaxID=1620943 RepID=A0ABV6M4T7_9ACTN
MIDVLTLGEAMASLRISGPVRLGGALTLSIAGAESNVAIGLSRLGHRTRWLGVTGDDELGELVLRTLRAENVDLYGCRTDPHAPTGLVLFERRLATVTRVRYFRDGSAGSTLSAEDILPVLADPPPRLLHVTGVTPALGAGPLAAVRTAMKLAQQAGTGVCLDVNYRATLWSPAEASHALRPLLPYVDVLFASDEELTIMADGSDRVERLLTSGVREVVVKRAADGASVHTVDGVAHQTARRISLVDTIGAGDAFAAGYLSATLDGSDIATKLRRAVDTAAFAVSTDGDWEGLPTRADLALLATEPGGAQR